MDKMDDLKTDILKVILKIAQSIKYNNFLNERYLHHLFSHQLQKEHDLLKLAGDNATIFFHPEWPTYKKKTALDYGRYKKENRLYKSNATGKAGFIDFAIGDYNKPDIGIEFSLKYGWSNEEVVYDFMKLLDKKNPFKASISFNVIFRERRLVESGQLTKLEKSINNAYREATSRLKNDVDNSRELYFIVTEIDKGNNRRHWHLDKRSSLFKNGLPVIA